VCSAGAFNVQILSRSSGWRRRSWCLLWREADWMRSPAASVAATSEAIVQPSSFPRRDRRGSAPVRRLGSGWRGASSTPAAWRGAGAPSLQRAGWAHRPRRLFELATAHRGGSVKPPGREHDLVVSESLVITRAHRGSWYPPMSRRDQQVETNKQRPSPSDGGGEEAFGHAPDPNVQHRGPRQTAMGSSRDRSEAPVPRRPGSCWGQTCQPAPPAP
jgi:hypothetical protein